MRCRDLFSVTLLVVSERAQNRRENHARAVNPGHGFMEANGTTGLGFRNAGRADRIVGGDEVEIAGHGAQDQVRRAIAIAGVLATGAERSDQGCDQGRGGNQSELLVDFEHARALVEERCSLALPSVCSGVKPRSRAKARSCC